jgi:hypothetical protein
LPVFGLPSALGTNDVLKFWRDTHERLRAVLTDPGRQRFNGIDARRYLLSGFLVCGRLWRLRQDRAPG